MAFAHDKPKRRRIGLGSLRQLEIIVLDDADAWCVVLVTDISLERRRFTKVDTVLERACQRLDGVIGRNDLDPVHRDARRDLLIERRPTVGFAGIINPNRAPPVPARHSLS